MPTAASGRSKQRYGRAKLLCNGGGWRGGRGGRRRGGRGRGREAGVEAAWHAQDQLGANGEGGGAGAGQLLEAARLQRAHQCLDECRARVTCAALGEVALEAGCERPALCSECEVVGAFHAREHEVALVQPRAEQAHHPVQVGAVRRALLAHLRAHPPQCLPHARPLVLRHLLPYQALRVVRTGRLHGGARCEAGCGRGGEGLL
mmetsp:Transcript_19575/g.75155  ORF Transcript_19575/g.75155 Transcript_19575/m.75155 type:complete len:204 (+) Transcript_19575:283-894(+)